MSKSAHTITENAKNKVQLQKKQRKYDFNIFYSMGRLKGTPKTGGRQKGTPNKATAAVKNYIADTLQRYMQPTDEDSNEPNLQKDLREMLPEDRVKAMTQLAAYVIPKQQALSIEEQTQAEADALTIWLQDAPDEAIDGIAARLLQMQNENTNAIS